LKASKAEIEKQAQINVVSLGMGNAGSINLNVEQLTLNSE